MVSEKWVTNKYKFLVQNEIVEYYEFKAKK
jgi:hypothetical protein